MEAGGVKGLIQEEYHDFLPLFEEAVTDQLPPRRPSDHTIPLKEEFQPPFGPSTRCLSSSRRPQRPGWRADGILNKYAFLTRGGVGIDREELVAVVSQDSELKRNMGASLLPKEAGVWISCE